MQRMPTDISQLLAMLSSLHASQGGAVASAVGVKAEGPGVVIAPRAKDGGRAVVHRNVTISGSNVNISPDASGLGSNAEVSNVDIKANNVSVRPEAIGDRSVAVVSDLIIHQKQNEAASVAAKQVKNDAPVAAQDAKEDLLIKELNTLFKESAAIIKIDNEYREMRFSRQELNNFHNYFKKRLFDFITIVSSLDKNKLDSMPHVGFTAQLLTSSRSGYSDQLISDLAYQFTHNFQHQIAKLSAVGIKQFARCAVKRLISHFYTVKNEDKTVLLQQSDEDKLQSLLFAIIDGKASLRRRSVLIETAQPTQDAKWTDEGILHSGFQLLNTPRRFINRSATEPMKRINKYGFHYGAKAEQAHYKLNDEIRPEVPSRPVRVVR
jgi:predicted transposase YbfD/YdcC